MEKVTKLQKEVQMTQIEMQKLQLQININWEATIVANQVKVFFLTYQQISPYEQIEDDATIEREVKQVEEEGKSIEVVEKGKQIPTNVDIVDIFDEYETTPLSYIYQQSAIKEEPSNAKKGKNQVGTSKERTKGFKGWKLVQEKREWRLK